VVFLDEKSKRKTENGKLLEKDISIFRKLATFWNLFIKLSCCTTNKKLPSPCSSVYWKAWTKRSTSSTSRPTGKSLMVIWRSRPLPSIMYSALKQVCIYYSSNGCIIHLKFLSFLFFWFQRQKRFLFWKFLKVHF